MSNLAVLSVASTISTLAAGPPPRGGSRFGDLGGRCRSASVASTSFYRPEVVLNSAVSTTGKNRVTGLLFHDQRTITLPFLAVSVVDAGIGGHFMQKRGDYRIQRCSAITATAGGEDVVIPEKSISVILLAGGKGKRMGANMPKQYLPLLGQPIALHSFRTFADMPEVVEIVVVCDPSYRDIFEDANVGVPLKFALPGKERQDSVRSGLQEISSSSKLACIHDSARPLVLRKDILKVLKDAWTTGAAVLGVPVKATIKEAAGNDRLVSKTLDRRTLWEMQTPQVIEPQLLHRGFELVEQEGYEVTDDVSIVEYLKHPVLITEGSYTNLKVTTPDDLLVAERILHQTATPVPV